MAWGMKLLDYRLVVPYCLGHENGAQRSGAAGLGPALVDNNSRAAGLGHEIVNKTTSADGLGA